MDVFDILDLISGFGSRRRSDSCPKRRKSSLHYLEEKRGYNKEGDHPPLFSMSEESKNIFNKLSKNKAKYQCLFDVYSIILGQYVSSTDDQEDKENVKETMFQQRIDDLLKYFENENLEIKDKDYKLFTTLCETLLKKELDKVQEDRELYYYVKETIQKDNEEFCKKYLYTITTN